MKVFRGYKLTSKLKKQRSASGAAWMRLDWEQHKKNLVLENEFDKMYIMFADDFNLLLSKCLPFLLQGKRKSAKRPAIPPEITLAATLRRLAHGSFHDIRTNMGMSRH